MIILDVEQGTKEWHEARRGVITASSFDKIITSKGAKSTQAKAYMNTLLAEKFSGKIEDSFGSKWTERGTETEPEALKYYEFKKNCDVTRVGVVYRSDKRVFACSPDGLIMSEQKGLEIKCPKGSTQIETLTRGTIPSKHIAQVQGSMWVTGFNEWDFLSYHPDLPSLLVTVKRDPVFHKALDKYLYNFLAEMNEKSKLIKQFRRK